MVSKFHLKSMLIIIASFLLLVGCQDIKNRNNPDSIANINPQLFADNVKGSVFIPDPKQNNCLTCHNGIEPIRNPGSDMMQEIYRRAARAGYENNECIVCHGGNPEAKLALDAHKGSVDYFLKSEGPKEFYPEPGSPWINENTCGMCHEEQVITQFTSLMFTEAGKIQGTTWGFGGIQGYEHNVANIEVVEVEAHKRLGSETYKKYMDQVKKAEPQVFPGKMKGLPQAPSAEDVENNPQLAVYTYLRQECQRCHIGVKGSNADADFRGMGCSSCHIPYSNKGLYEGGDVSVSKTEKGHMLVHSIQATREAKVNVHGHSYSGIPSKTCTSCHNRGRRIGVSYEGLMETSYRSPFMSNGDGQSKLHKKNYIHMKPDVHLTKGMLCQDCHTSGDAHSMGDLSGAIQGAVEIECQDCHGTPTAFPWELPIGYGDEIIGSVPASGEPRGLAQEIPEYLNKGTVYEKEDGYLISSRGNAMPHLVKRGDVIILHSAGGKDIVLQPLKKLTDEDILPLEAKVSMVQIGKHMEQMECYSCHATWAPQCYGCHINIDYSKEDCEKLDWVKVAEDQDVNGLTPDAVSIEDAKKIKEYLISGDIEEQRSFLRWEDPPLVVNGEHRVSPAIPGCQTTVSIKGKDGKMILLNHIFKIPNVEGADEQGQLAIDMSPLQPHTIQKVARNCESCHNNPKAMGYGIDEGKLYYQPDTNFVMDLLDAYGKPIPQQVDTQFNTIANLGMDWSRFLDEQGNQLQTVGHHFSGSRPLNEEELRMLDRRGVCLSCHQIIPDKDIAANFMSHVAKYAGVEIDNNAHSSILNKAIQISAWVQVLIPVFIVLIFFVGIRWWKKRKIKN